MASFRYEREHAPGRQPGAGPLEHRRREAGELWTALSLEPDASRGEPAVVRDGYFRPPAAFPVPSVGETEEEPPAEEPPEEEQAAAAGVPAAAPKSLRPTKTTHSKSAAWAYETRLGYEVLDDKGTPIKGFDVNEKWTTAI